MSSQQPDLFAAGSPEPAPESRIEGLQYIPAFLTPAEQSRLLDEVDARPWLTELKRRVQHYGYRYDYRSRSVDRSLYLGPLPDWAAALAGSLLERGLLGRLPDQLIVNEYQPGQGISQHVDCVPCFDDNIVSLSLGSTCVLRFTHKQTREVVPVWLEPGSAVVMTGPARYDWLHGIRACKSDSWAGRTWPRGRRVSLTFRKVLLAEPGA
jgi:alkylated DNA repair dioxygenase AlkB